MSGIFGKLFEGRGLRAAEKDTTEIAIKEAEEVAIKDAEKAVAEAQEKLKNLRGKKKTMGDNADTTGIDKEIEKATKELEAAQGKEASAKAGAKAGAQAARDVYNSFKKDIEQLLEKDPKAAAEKTKWYKKPTNAIIALFIAYEVLTASQMQEADECYNKCTHKGSASNDSPYANCPPPSNSPWSNNMNLFGQRHPTDKCKVFCGKDTGECSQKKRVAAAQKSVEDNPLGATAGALGKAISGPVQAWDTLKNFVFIFAGIIALVIFYKVIRGFTSNVGKSAAEYGKTKATKLFTSGNSGKN
jgi:hypothetical protein